MNKDDLFRISLKALIRNEAGELLVVKEKGQMHWNLPGGGMDHGETYHEALARELREEIGFSGEFVERLVGCHDARMLPRDESIWQTIIVFEIDGIGETFVAVEHAKEVRFISPGMVAKDQEAYSLVVEEYCR